jgi:hypothetical protein
MLRHDRWQYEMQDLVDHKNRRSDRLESEIGLHRLSHVVQDSHMTRTIRSHSLSRMDDLRRQVVDHGVALNHRSPGCSCNCAPLLPPHNNGREVMRVMRVMLITEASIGGVDDDCE